jgi:hypothetical protein
MSRSGKRLKAEGHNQNLRPSAYSLYLEKDMAPPEPQASGIRPQPSDDEDRLGALALGFALGELAPAELQELYDALRRDGDAGRGAARVVWRTLGTTVDLRSAVGRQFQDTVRHRLEADARGDSFVRGILGRIGLTRPRLQEVTLPETPPRPRRRWLVPALLGLAAAAAAAALLIGRRPAPDGPRAAEVRGLATVDGRPIASGARLDIRPVVLPAGGSIIIDWPDGHRAEITGPAHVFTHADGLWILAGMARVRAAGAFRIGLPDQRIDCLEGTEAVVAIRDNRSVVGVAAGSAVSDRGDAAAPVSLTAGEAGDSDGRVFRWESGVRWETVPGGRRLSCDPGASAWRLEGLVARGRPDERLSMTMERSPLPAIEFTADAVLLRNAAGERRVDLSGAPLLARRVVMQAWPGSAASLRIEGADGPATLPFDGPPRGLIVSGAARLEDADFFTGPAPGAAAGGQ